MLKHGMTTARTQITTLHITIYSFYDTTETKLVTTLGHAIVLLVADVFEADVALNNYFLDFLGFLLRLGHC
jgi:hypothetical protein